MGSVKYFLKKNKLTTSDTNDYLAYVKQGSSVGFDEILAKMIDRGSTVTKAEAMSVLEEFFAAMSYLLELGNNVSLDYFKIRTSIKGKFEDESDSFDPARHEIRLNMNAGKRLLNSLQNLSASKVTATVVAPELVNLLDVASGDNNSTLTAGGQAKITGSNLKFDLSDTTQGVFFVDSSGTETRATSFATISPSTLTFLVPGTLTSGDFQVKVRNKPGGSTLIKEGSLPDQLVIA